MNGALAICVTKCWPLEARHDRRRAMNRRATILLLIFTLAGAFALRILYLGERSLWFDEAFSYTLVERFSCWDMIQHTAQDVHPPLYYLLLRGWVALFGTSLVALRSLSVLFGLGAVGAMYLFVRDTWLFAMSGPGETERRDARFAGICAALVMAVTGSQVRWSWEARMYALGTLLVVLASWCLVRALAAGRRSGWWWAAYSLTSAALLYTHNFGLFSFASQVLFLFLYFALMWRNDNQVVAQSSTLETPARNRTLVSVLSTVKKVCWRPWKSLASAQFRWALVAIILTSLVYLPWLPILQAQKAQVQQDYWMPRATLWSVVEGWYRLTVPTNWHMTGAWVGPLVVAGLLVIILAALVYKARPGEWLVFLSAVGPVALAVLVSFCCVAVIVARQFLFAQVFCVAAAALAVAKWFVGLERWIVAGWLAGSSLFLLVTFVGELDIPNRPGLAGATEFVLKQREAEEPVVVLHPLLYFSVRYCAEGRAEPRLFARRDQIKHYTGGPLVLDADLIGADELAGTAGNCIWVLDTNGYGGVCTRAPLPNQWIPTTTTKEFPDVYSFQGTVTATEYVRR